jgi:hypothetical protein
MITNQLKDLLKRCAAAMRRRPASRGLARHTFEIRRFCLVVAAFLGLTLPLAVGQDPKPPADGPDPTPGPSQPVLEQNLDANGLIRVHEQGTANVNVTNVPLPVSGNVNVTGSAVRATIPPATTTFRHTFTLGPGDPSPEIPFPTINASAIHVQLGDYDPEIKVFFKSPLVDTGFSQGLFVLKADATHKGDLITFTQPVPINGVEAHCTQNVFTCSAFVSVVGVAVASP